MFSADGLGDHGGNSGSLNARVSKRCFHIISCYLTNTKGGAIKI